MAKKEMVMDQENSDVERARQDDRKRREDREQARLKAQEKEENEAPRKAVSDAVDYVKNKASELGDEVTKFAKEYGNVYKKGLGMKEGGKVKSASARADGIAIRGKTRA
jgi:hypothetical protein